MVLFGPLLDLVVDGVLCVLLLLEFEELLDFAGLILHGTECQLVRRGIVFRGCQAVIVDES